MAVYALMFVIIVTGIYAYIAIPREANPDITIPVVLVTTIYPGVSPSDIEVLITNELEKELKNLENVKEIRSSSQEDASVVSIEFDAGVDIDAAVQKVRDKVNIAKVNIPSDADEPLIEEINFSDLPVMIINISGEYGLVKLKDIAEDVRDKIEQIPGVLKVDLSGGLEREVKVDVDPERLRYYNLSLKDIIDAIEEENVTIPGGSIDIGDYKYLVRIPGEYQDPLLIKNIVVKSVDHRPVYLHNLADVSFGFQDIESFARLNGVETISLSVKKRSGENLLAVAESIYSLIEEEKRLLPRTTKFVITSDASKETRTLVRDLENNVITSLGVIILVLFLTLGIRVAVFVAFSIPFSLFISFVIFFVLGYTMNMVILFSLILALGMLVDNAIVIVENIFRHFEEGSDPVRSAIEGSAEVAQPVIFSTLTTLSAFFPIMFWPGIVGEFMYYLPVTLIIALSSSLFVALVINPTLCATLLKLSAQDKTKKKMSELADSELPKFYRYYKRLLTYALVRPIKTLIVATASLILVLGIYPLFGKGTEFFPDIDPNLVFVNIDVPSGFRSEVIDESAKIAESRIAKYEDVSSYVSNIGGFTSNVIQGESAGVSARIAIDFVDREERLRSSQETKEQIRDELKNLVVGLEFNIDEQEQGPPTGPPINIEISGADFDIIASMSHELEELLKKVDGLVDIDNNYSVGKPEIVVDVDRAKVAQYGLRTLDIANYVRWAIHGAIASTYREGDDEYDIMVRFKGDRADQITKINQFFIKHEGNLIPLSSAAKIRTAAGYSDIKHIDLKKVVTVSAEVDSNFNENEKLEAVKKLVKEEIKPIEGYRISYTGQDEEQKEASEFLTKAFTGAVLLILFILVLQFNSVATPIIILSSVVLSMIGVLIGLMVTQTPFGIIMSGVGVISLAGIVVNNSIVLLDYTNQLRYRGFEKHDAIVLAGMVRLRPVLLTTITTTLGLMPMVLKISYDFVDLKLLLNSEMAEWWGPMATTVVFGLGFATMLTLLFAPTLYSLLDTLVYRFTGKSLVGIDKITEQVK